MHITSLPCDEGIGTLGKPAFQFIDWLKSAGQTYWQILPVNPTGYGDSPYQSPSSFAGNPLLIDLTELVNMGLLAPIDIKGREYGEDPNNVDYDKVYKQKDLLLRKAFSKFEEDMPYLAFVQEQAWWLEDYALFMAIKKSYDLKPFLMWDKRLQKREDKALKQFSNENIAEIKFRYFEQYIFFLQWKKMKAYANSKGIRIIGDIPIYCALDSADVWAQPELFTMDTELNPVLVAGVPPDYFSATGQLWGNPLYNLDKME